MQDLINFPNWIKQFTKEDSDKGIFARWFIHNDITSTTAKFTKKSFVGKMEKNGCSNYLVENFEKIWNEFEQIPNAQVLSQRMITLNHKSI